MRVMPFSPRDLATLPRVLLFASTSGTAPPLAFATDGSRCAFFGSRSPGFAGACDFGEVDAVVDTSFAEGTASLAASPFFEGPLVGSVKANGKSAGSKYWTSSLMGLTPGKDVPT